MKIVKKIAKRILSEELAKIESLWKEKNDNLRIEIEVLEKSNQKFKRLAFGVNKYLVSQLMFECIVKCLPDPNKVGTGNITPSEVSMCNMRFVDKSCGELHDHKCYVKEIKEKSDGSGEKGAVVHITDYNMNIFIPLRREDINYEIYGVQTNIDTYFWDFYRAGIRMVGEDSWALSKEFILAQRNVLKELRKGNLL